MGALTLRVAGAALRYPDGTLALEGVNLSLREGENVALVGANGAGKTSLLLALAGVLPLAAGAVEFIDEENNRGDRSRVGLVFQNPDDQLFMPTIAEDVAFGPRNQSLPEPSVQERVTDALASLRISHLADRSPLKLSGGEKRLCALATVLAMRPAFLLLDEPTAFLDPKARRVLAELLTSLPQGKLVATHDLDFAAKTCARYALLEQGKLSAEGPLSPAAASALQRALEHDTADA